MTCSLPELIRDVLALQSHLGRSARDQTVLELFGTYTAMLSPNEPHDTLSTLAMLVAAADIEDNSGLAKKIRTLQLQNTPPTGATRIALHHHNEVGQGHMMEGNFGEAEQAHQRAYDIAKLLFGIDHFETLQSEMQVEYARLEQGLPNNAETYRAQLEDRMRAGDLPFN